MPNRGSLHQPSPVSPPNRVSRVWVATIFLACLGLVLFGSPLFRVLGFEYAAVAGLMLSLVVGLLISTSLVSGPVKPWSTLYGLLPQLGVLFLIPLITGLLSAIFISNCALWDGILFYFEIALPAVIISTIFGTACGILARKKKWAVLLYLGVWFSSLALSFVPGYFTPQIFTYGWQYGFFPGLVWDDALTLTRSYALFQLGAVLISLLVLQFARLFRMRPAAPTTRDVLILIVLVVGVTTISLLSDDMRIISSHARVEKFLSGRIDVDHHTIVRFKPGDLTVDEQRLLKGNLLWYLHDIRERMGLHDTSRDFRIYVYPGSDERYEFVGTRSANIAKPWLGELHITKGSLRSLKHELTHLLMAEVGSFPFYISWATGLTEGVAMSIELPYDGLRSINQQAARVVQTRPHSGVQEIMSFAGFASNASFTSYTLAGSFSRYLLDHYGSAPYIKVYKTLDFENVYHQSLSQLEQEWLAALKPFETPMTVYDSLRTLNGISDTSVLYRPCLRRIGKLMAAASSAMKKHMLLKADSLYAIVFKESGRSNALAGRLYAQIELHRPLVALKILDSTAKPLSNYWYVTLGTRAVAEYLAKDTSVAIRDFSTLAAIGASDASLVDSYIFARTLAQPLSRGAGTDWVKYFYASYTGISARAHAVMIDSILERSVDSVRPYLTYLSAMSWLAAGRIYAAERRLHECIPTLRAGSIEDSLIITLAKMRLAVLEESEPQLTEVPAGFDGLLEDITEAKNKISYLRSIGYSLDH